MENVGQSALCVVLAIVALALKGSAQNHNQSAAAPKNQIRVVPTEVTVPVTVTDNSGDFVLDLQQKDFQVFDDGTRQNQLAILQHVEARDRVTQRCSQKHIRGEMRLQRDAREAKRSGSAIGHPAHPGVPFSIAPRYHRGH